MSEYYAVNDVVLPCGGGSHSRGLKAAYSMQTEVTAGVQAIQPYEEAQPRVARGRQEDGGRHDQKGRKERRG